MNIIPYMIHMIQYIFVTLEDILETLVGKIYDEDDDEEVQEEVTSIVQNKDGSWSIDGMAELEAKKIHIIYYIIYILRVYIYIY